jgi:hypothetical protein
MRVIYDAMSPMPEAVPPETTFHDQSPHDEGDIAGFSTLISVTPR